MLSDVWVGALRPWEPYEEDPMRYLMMSKTNEFFEAGNPPSPELFQRMGEFMRDAAAAGVLLQTDGLMPSSFGTRMSAHGGEVTVTDGPFAEAKELVGGLAFIEVRDLDEAKEWGRRFLQAHEGEVDIEIRQVTGPEGPGGTP